MNQTGWSRPECCSMGPLASTVSKRTHVRDQERAPVAAQAQGGVRTFALTADVAEAHRQILVAKCDWHLLWCQVTPDEEVYVNTVGAFGVASASCYVSRVASALVRLSPISCRKPRADMAHADDYHLESCGEDYRSALFIFFVLCDTAGVPFSWNKTAGVRHH